MLYHFERTLILNRNMVLPLDRIQKVGSLIDFLENIKIRIRTRV